jgi:multisubunit Na+/H+ antiporter MnhB subunit
MSARNIVAVAFFVIIAVFLFFSALLIHPFGEFDDDTNPEMDQYIIDNAQKETGADNGVTSVVFDYRGFDTLGEATVLFTAVAGVILLFRRLKK